MINLNMTGEGGSDVTSLPAPLLDSSTHKEFVAIPGAKTPTHVNLALGCLNHAECVLVTCILFIQWRQLRFERRVVRLPPSGVREGKMSSWLIPASPDGRHNGLYVSHGRIFPAKELSDLGRRPGPKPHQLGHSNA